MLHELGSDLRQDEPTLEEFRRWGPAVWLEALEDGSAINMLATGFWRGSGQALRSFNRGFAFDTQKPDVKWTVWKWDAGQVVEEYLPLKPFYSDGVLDTRALLQKLRKQAKKWKFTSHKQA